MVSINNKCDLADRDLGIPLVSVIIPSYNHAIYIAETIRSVVAQDYANLELIVIDDGSKDNSIEIIEKILRQYDRRFIRCTFRHRPNKGLSATLNEGLAWSRGELFSCVASDDMLRPEKTSLQVDYLSATPDCLGVFGSVSVLNQRTGESQDGPLRKRRYVFRDIFLHRHMLPAPTQLLRTEAVRRIGGFDERTTIEDWWMWLHLTKKGGTLDCMPFIFATYRKHASNTSNAYRKMILERERILLEFKNEPEYDTARANALMMGANDLIDQSRLSSARVAWQAIVLVPKTIISKSFVSYCAKLLLPAIMIRRMRLIWGR